MYNVVYNIFNLTWTESVALYMDDKDGESYMNSVLQTVFNLFVTANVGIIACMPFVFFILVDKSYYDAYYQIPIQMLAALFNVIAGLYSVVYIAKKLTNQIAKTTVLAAVINVVVHLLLIKNIGLYASSISSLVAYMVLAIVRYKGTKKYKNLRIPAKYILMAMLSYVIVFVG
jgi:O-antigen/teichoic acid export membrane protein